MKPLKTFAAALALVSVLTACDTTQKTGSNQDPPPSGNSEIIANAIKIQLDDKGIKVNDAPVESDPDDAVYVAGSRQSRC